MRRRRARLDVTQLLGELLSCYDDRWNPPVTDDALTLVAAWAAWPHRDDWLAATAKPRTLPAQAN